MKKIKLLTPILGLTALSSALVPLASCSCNASECTITFNATTGGSITGSTTAKVNKGTKWSDVTKPTYQAESGYEFEDWYNGDNVMKSTDVISNNITITAHFIQSAGPTPVIIKQTINSFQELLDMQCYDEYWNGTDPLDTDLWTKPLSQDPNPIKVIIQDIIFTIYYDTYVSDWDFAQYPLYLDLEISDFDPVTKAITGLYYVSPFGEKPDVPPQPSSSSTKHSDVNDLGCNFWIEFENIILDIRQPSGLSATPNPPMPYMIKPIMLWDGTRQAGNWKISGVYDYNPTPSNEGNEPFSFDQNCNDTAFNEMLSIIGDKKYFDSTWMSYYYARYMLFDDPSSI